MELVERYLQAVRFLLPQRQRDDVARELSADLRSEIEDKEGELGRPLTEDELAALLKRLGHPFVLALRYRQGRYLIGPTIFPLYWLAVKYVSAILVVVHIVLPAAFFLATAEPAARVFGLFGRFPGVAMPVLAWMTFGFAVLETQPVWSVVERSLASWRPQALPPLVKEQPKRCPSMASLVLEALLSVWWLVGLQLPHLLLGPAAHYVGFGAIFYRLYPAMAVAAAAKVAFVWLRLSRPHRAQLLLWSGLSVEALNLAILSALWRGSDWIVAGPGLASLQGQEGVIALVNVCTGIGLTIALAVGTVKLTLRGIREWGRVGIPERV